MKQNRTASISDLNKLPASLHLSWSPEFPFRVHHEQLCQSGFNVGNMEYVGHSDYSTEAEAQAAVESWIK